jgi:hypothetical protein
MGQEQQARELSDLGHHPFLHRGDAGKDQKIGKEVEKKDYTGR